MSQLIQDQQWKSHNQLQIQQKEQSYSLQTGQPSISIKSTTSLQTNSRVKLFLATFIFLLIIIITFKPDNENMDIPSQAINKQSLNSKISLSQSEIQKIIMLNDRQFNLWDLTEQDKKELLNVYDQYLQQNIIKNPSLMNILSNKDSQAQHYIRQFQKHASEIKWAQISINQQTMSQYQIMLSHISQERQNKIGINLIDYHDYQSNQEGMNASISITKSQFYKAIKFHRINSLLKDQQLYSTAYQEYDAYIQQKYSPNNISQLAACVIVPTFNNAKDHRYLWNIQSILQQQYSNFRVIIIDDASDDNTSQLIGDYLRWRKADPTKYILIKSMRRNKSLYSFYYAAHKYCNLGQIIYTIDGDDELVGTQVFKTINAIYQKQKPYTLYSSFIIDEGRKLELCHNREYSSKVKDENSYRADRSHAYSHLRTMLSDMFLLVNASSLKYKDDKFYQLITDNAVYFPAMELSCKKVRFLPEINYWYNYATGDNIFKRIKLKQYREIEAHVRAKKPYRCFHQYLQQAYEWKKSNS